MPIYEYRCVSCGHVFEDFRQSTDKDDVQLCEKCGKPKVERVMSVFSSCGGGRGGGACGPSSGPFT